MLTSVKIQNIALIPELEIEFGKGLNVLTGETGAGKSIIIGSFNFVLGEKLGKNVIRQGAAFARVDAIFNVLGAELEIVKEICGLDFAENLVILSRTLKNDGKSECRINGNIVTAEILKSVAQVFVNVHGQHETEVLLKTKNHVNILDSFGGQKIRIAKQEFSEEYQKLQSLIKSLQVYGGTDSERKRMIDMYDYQIREIENARLKNDEDIELTEKKQKMMNFEKISTGISSALQTCHADGGLETQLKKFISALSGISHLDSRIEKFLDTAKSIKIDINELGSDIRDYGDGLEFDEDEYKRVDERLDTIKVLKRKYGQSTAEIFAFLIDARTQLNFLQRSEEDMAKIKKQIEVQEGITKSLAAKLTEARREAAKTLETRIIAELQDLNMPNCRFVCDIDDSKISANGADAVEFLFSANTGQDVRPLAHIISGGEMSRFMLALKTVTANLEGVSTLVFDEIDTGISGIIAHKIAEKMESICKFHQVIAVTHLAQIASRANHHLYISKQERDGKTITSVRTLNPDESKTELTRMAGGADFLAKMK